MIVIPHAIKEGRKGGGVGTVHAAGLVAALNNQAVDELERVGWISARRIVALGNVNMIAGGGG